MAEPQLKQKLALLGAEPLIVSTTEYAKFIATDSRKWADLIQSIGIKPQ